MNKHLFNTALISKHTQPPSPLLFLSLSLTHSLTHSHCINSIANYFHFQEPRNLLFVKNKATKNTQSGYSPGRYDPLVRKKNESLKVVFLLDALLLSPPSFKEVEWGWTLKAISYS